MLVDNTNNKIFIFTYLSEVVEDQIKRRAIITINKRKTLQQYNESYLGTQEDMQGLMFKLF